MSASLALLDPYLPSKSCVHRADATVKLLVTLAAVIAVSATSVRAWPVHLTYFALLLLAVALARLPLRSVLRRSLLAAPFLLMALVGLPFVHEGRPLWALLGGRLTVTDVGLERLANVAVKGWLSLLAVVTLTLTTPFTEIVRGTRRLGLPAVLSTTILLMYRYLFVLVDEAQRLMRARDARSGEGYGGSPRQALRFRAQVTGRLIGTLFLRTLERSERIYHAMLARGYDGEIRRLAPARLGSAQTALGVVLGLLLAALAVWANLTW
jgi:cobalt/nickel transport system permease protein